MKRIFIMLIVAMFSFSVEAQDLNPKDVLDSINEKVLDSCNVFTTDYYSIFYR